jgi:hypothetical protein
MRRVAFERMWFGSSDCRAHACEEGEGAFCGGGGGERRHFGDVYLGCGMEYVNDLSGAWRLYVFEWYESEEGSWVLRVEGVKE